MENELKQTALVILAHGSSKNANSALSAQEHKDRLAAKGLFAEVLAGFWKQSPQIQDVLKEVTAARVVVVPLFISEGFFSEEIIPVELGFGKERILQRGSQQFRYCKVVGTHERITEAVLARAEEIVAAHPFPFAPAPSKMALFIAGHGTEQNPESRASVEKQAEKIRTMKRYTEVQTIYMDEDPRIGSYHTMTQCKNVIVVPFFISDGLHSLEDIPVALGDPHKVVQERLAKGQPTWRNPTEKFGKLVWYARSVGTHPLVTDLILDRAKQVLAK